MQKIKNYLRSSLLFVLSFFLFFFIVIGYKTSFFGSQFFISIMLSFFTFFIGAFGIFFNRKNIVLSLVSIEVMFLGANLLFIFSYVFLGHDLGLVYALLNLSVAAAEAVVGFGLLIASFRKQPNINFKSFNRLKG